MAEDSHCYFCFDVIASTLSRPKKSPLSLSQIEDTFEAYSRSQASATSSSGNVSHNGTNGHGHTNGSSNYAIAGRVVTNGATITNGTSNLQNGVSTCRNRDRPARPLFVTWNVVKLDDKRLRGCIGTFEDHELEEGLRAYALTSAFDDTRFNPISNKDLSTLECGVSILTDFEPCSHPLDWTLGVHGLRISFVYHSRRLGATYLPDVPSEQGWTQEETIVSLMRKAGWSGRKTEWRKVGSLSVTRYQGTRAYVGWEEYRQLMDWRQEHVKELERGT